MTTQANADRVGQIAYAYNIESGIARLTGATQK